MQLQAQDPLTPDPNTISEHGQYDRVLVNGKKTFVCLAPDCGKTFKYKSDMERHQTIHSDERPYSCSYPDCGKTFKRPDALNSHLRIHLKKPPFSCPMSNCLSTFNTKSALQYHLLKHKGEKTFKCTIAGCDKAFLTITHLKQHENTLCYHQRLKNLTSPIHPIVNQISPTLPCFLNDPNLPVLQLQPRRSSLRPKNFDFPIKTEVPNGDMKLEGNLKFEEDDDRHSAQSSTGNYFFNVNRTERETFDISKALPNALDIFNDAESAPKEKQDQLMGLLNKLKEENQALKVKIQQNMNRLRMSSEESPQGVE